MSLDEQAQLEAQLKAAKQRKHFRELEKAKRGISADPYILIDIEEAEQEIKEVEAKLAALNARRATGTGDGGAGAGTGTGDRGAGASTVIEKPNGTPAPTQPSVAPELFTLEINADNSIRAEWGKPGERPEEGRLVDDRDLRKEILEYIARANEGKLDKDPDDIPKFGKKMYRALFPERIGFLFEQAVDTILAARHKGDKSRWLRVMLDVHPRSDVVREAWPLELLYSEQAEWLATHPVLALYRRVQGATSSEFRIGELPLKVLLVISLPAGLTGKVTPSFLQRIGKLATFPAGAGAQSARPRMDIRVLGLLEEAVGIEGIGYCGKPATLLTINEQMGDAWAPDVLHFVGHGQWESARGSLGLIDGDEEPVAWIPGEIIASLFRAWQPGVVLLQGCEGAQSGTEPAFMDVVNKLVDKNIPALVATQFSITDQYAALFAEAFYTALCNGKDVDAAVQSARNQIGLTCASKAHHFATPVLFASNPASILPRL